jgi:hypothetical protein
LSLSAVTCAYKRTEIGPDDFLVQQIERRA